MSVLLLIGLLSFRVALWRIKRMNMDYGNALGIIDFHLYPPTLQLFTHRLAIYTLVCAILDHFWGDFRVIELSLLTIPILYIITRHDPVMMAFKRSLMQAVLMTKREVDFSIVVFSDVLTSYARVLPIMGGILLQDIIKGRWNDLLMAMLVALPFWIRLRQCLQEYQYNDAKSARSQYRSLINASRYATNFPVIFLALSGSRWSSLWIAFTIVNQFANAAWDLFMDWRISVMSPSDIFLVIVTLAIRIVWAMRACFPWLYQHPMVHYSVLGAEVCRRMIWVCLRVQSHCSQLEYATLIK